MLRTFFKLCDWLEIFEQPIRMRKMSKDENDLYVLESWDQMTLNNYEGWAVVVVFKCSACSPTSMIRVRIPLMSAVFFCKICV